MNDADVGVGGDLRVELVVGPVTLTHETGAARTHEVTLRAAWNHALLPRPVRPAP